MDAEELRRLLRSSRVDLWALMDAAVALAAAEHGPELRARRDGIVERLYVTAPSADRCRSCHALNGSGSARDEAEDGEYEEEKGVSSPARKRSPSPESMSGEEEEEQEAAGEGEDELSKILAIKEFLEDPDQSEDSLVNLLQNLADMDITFKALKETDIGRNVNGLRKHPSSDVRRLVKQLVRKWKDLVDEWVKSSSTGDAASPAIITDGDSPQQIAGRAHQNGHQVSEFGYSPNPHNGYLSSEKNNGSESVEPKPKAAAITLPPRREAPAAKPNNNNNINYHHPTTPSAIPAKVKVQKDSLMDPDRLASARKRLHENYQEAENAKKQRTVQVMGIHEIPKPKNSLARKGGFQGKHW